MLQKNAFQLEVVHKLRGQPGWVGGSEKADFMSTFTIVDRVGGSKKTKKLST